MSVAESTVLENPARSVLESLSQERSWSSEKAVVIGLWVAWILASLPLFLIRILPAVDYPDHLARIFVLAHGMSLPGYAQFYHPHWALLPNLAFDLVMVSLAKILPIEIAGRLFVMLLFGLTIYGGARLNKALTGSWTWLALVPALLIYNRILSYGFLNFLCGVGLLLLALAIHIERRDDKPIKRLAIEAAFLIGLFTCHLVAMALYVACAVAYDFGRWLSTRPGKRKILSDLLVVCAPTGVLMAVFIKLSPMTGEASKWEFRDWYSKSKLLHMSFQTGQGMWDMVFGGLVVAFVIWLFATKKVRFSNWMVAPVAVLSVIFIASPTGFKQAMNVDTRIPLVLTVVALCALVPQQLNAKLVGMGVLSLLGLRCLTTSVHYAKWDRDIEGVLTDLREVPAGSVLLATRNVDSHAFDATNWNPPLMHLGCLLLLERPILADDLFTIPTQQPLLKNAPYDAINLTAKVGGTRARDIADYGREAGLEAIARGIAATPMYIFYVREPRALKVPPELTPLVMRKGYAIFKVNPEVLKHDKYSLPASETEENHVAGDMDRWNSSN